MLPAIADPQQDAYALAFQAGNREALAALDETPLWSAPFGQCLLETLQLKPGLQVLDIGCGSGFPTLELAARLGGGGQVTGLDPWKDGLAYAQAKAELRGISGAVFVEGIAEAMPFAEASFDAVVSNNGLNNVSEVRAALKECARVLRPGGQFVMTANLPGTFRVFYEVFERLLEEQALAFQIPHLRAHIAQKRKPLEEWKTLAGEAGIQIRGVREEVFTWSFLNGTALFKHWAVRLAFLSSWQELIPTAERSEFLSLLEDRLDQLALERGGLHLEVPFVCLDGRR